MKRICYLLTFFLTSFSIAANEASLRNTYLVANSGEIHEVNLEHLEPCPAPWPEDEVIEENLNREGQAESFGFICSVR